MYDGDHPSAYRTRCDALSRGIALTVKGVMTDKATTGAEEQVSIVGGEMGQSIKSETVNGY
jgi:hypothetical protein